MYNRYIPQPDGSFRRSSMQEQPRPRPASQRSGGQPGRPVQETPLPSKTAQRPQEQKSSPDPHTSVCQGVKPAQPLHGRQENRRRIIPPKGCPGSARQVPKPCPQPEPRPPRPTPEGCPKSSGSQGLGVLRFLRNLLPKDFDTGDLLVVLLILLMAGDCPEEQNTALLTLALYVFL